MSEPPKGGAKTQRPTKEKKPPLFERVRARRAERAEKTAADASSEPPTVPAQESKVDREAPAASPSVNLPPPPPARITSRPMKAEELRERGRVGIGGRLRWRDGEEGPGPEDTAVERQERVPAPPPAWRAVPAPGAAPRSRGAVIGTFIAHVLIAFFAGAALLAIAAIVASMSSDGRVALLEIRGLPILIAGATAIVVFTLLHTGPRAKGDRRAVAIGVVLGFLVLVAAVAAVYRPSLMAEAQQRLDRSLGIFGPEVTEAVGRFDGDVDQWNVEVNNYRNDMLKDLVDIRKSATTPEDLAAAEEEFRVEASGVEAGLDGIHKRMESHAEGIEQAPLRDAMRDLAAVFGDELAGVRLITRGFLSDDQALIQSGDTRFKDATARAVELVDERVRPILERAGIDPGPLERSVGELRGE